MENTLTGSTVIRSHEFDTQYQESVFVTNSLVVRYQMKAENYLTSVRDKFLDHGRHFKKE